MNENAPAFQAALTAAMSHALRHISPDEDLPVAPLAELKDVRARLDLPLGDVGMDPVEVLDELVEGAWRHCADDQR